MLMPDSVTKSTLRRCSVHRVVEVLPGLWKLDKFLTKPGVTSTQYDIIEVECPTCLHVAMATFRAQFPELYTSAALLHLPAA
jgi:hypothetical protein